jgi:hypothetical protein
MFFVMFAPYKEAYERSKIQSQTRNLLIFTDCIITIAIKKKKKKNKGIVARRINHYKTSSTLPRTHPAVKPTS